MKVKSEPRTQGKKPSEESNEKNTAIITKLNDRVKVGPFIRNYFSHLIVSKTQSHLAWKQGQVLVNGKAAKDFDILHTGDVVKVTRKIEETLKYKEGFKVDIRYEDEEIAVVWYIYILLITIEIIIKISKSQNFKISKFQKFINFLNFI